MFTQTVKYDFFVSLPTDDFFEKEVLLVRRDKALYNDLMEVVKNLIPDN